MDPEIKAEIEDIKADLVKTNEKIDKGFSQIQAGITELLGVKEPKKIEKKPEEKKKSTWKLKWIKFIGENGEEKKLKTYEEANDFLKIKPSQKTFVERRIYYAASLNSKKRLTDEKLMKQFDEFLEDHGLKDIIVKTQHSTE